MVRHEEKGNSNGKQGAKAEKKNENANNINFIASTFYRSRARFDCLLKRISLFANTSEAFNV